MVRVLVSRVLLSVPQSLEDDMKLSREFNNEQQAEARERMLQAEGYQAWRKRTPDGRWQLIWVVPAGRW